MSIPTHHPYDFDPTYGMGIDELRALRPPAAPADFDRVWQERHAAALTIDPRPKVVETPSDHPIWRVCDITYTSVGDFAIGGWLLLPRKGPVERGLVVGHGYGGRDRPDLDIAVEGTAILFPCFRGISRSRGDTIPSDPARHVLHGIDDPAHYVLGGCVGDAWVAVSVLARLFPEAADRIGYSGISFGGGIGALAIAADPRIARGYLEVPTFGNMPLWLELPTVGSGNAVQAYHATHPEVIETLRTFDSASAAARIDRPMLLAVARFDPAVAPPCQFSVANALASSSRHETVVLDAGHFDYPGSAEQHGLLGEKVGRFFGAM